MTAGWIFFFSGLPPAPGSEDDEWAEGPDVVVPIPERPGVPTDGLKWPLTASWRFSSTETDCIGRVVCWLDMIQERAMDTLPRRYRGRSRGERLGEGLDEWDSVFTTWFVEAICGGEAERRVFEVEEIGNISE